MSKKLTREDYIAFRDAYNDLNRSPDYTSLATFLGITKKAILRRASTYNSMREKDAKLPPIINRDEEHDSRLEQLFKWPKTDLKKLNGLGNIVVTSAQLGTPINKNVLNSLKVYCKHKKAKLVVMAIRYGPSHKKVTRKSSPNYGEYEQISHMSAHLTNDPDITVVYPDIDVAMINDNIGLNTIGLSPTLKDHVGRMGSVGDTVSHVIAAPVMRLEPVAINNNSTPKFNMTTGAVSYPRYRDGKAGREAIKSHCFGAILIEVKNDTIFHFRQLLSNRKGEFYDIDLNKYTPKGFKKELDAVNTLVTGDWHTGSTDPVVREVTYGKNGIVAKLKPKFIMKHDFADFKSVSHHDESDSVKMSRKSRQGKLCLETELKAVKDEARYILKQSARVGSTVVFVASNHNEHVDKWLGENHRHQKDYLNNRIYHYLSYLMEGDDVSEKEGAFDVYLRDKLSKKELDRCIFLTRDDDFEQPNIPGKSVKLDLHGDKGLSGSRGSISQFNRLGYRSFTGHTHAPGIFGSAWRVGTSSLYDLGYNSGPSTWMHTHGIVFKNGQRMLINIIDDTWHG